MLARFLGMDSPGFDAILQWIVTLRERISIPNTLSAIGFEERHVIELAEAAVADPTASTNPIALNTANIQGLFSDALQGRL